MTAKNLKEDIVNFGFESHKDGYERWENPYRKGTKNYKSWDFGWLKAENKS